MSLRFAKSPLFWAASALAVAWLAHRATTSPSIAEHEPLPWLQLENPADPATGWLTKPFLTPRGDVGLALDGGEIPLLSILVPQIEFGPPARHPLQLAMIIDWQCEDSRRLLDALHRLYSDGTDASDLPSLHLMLLPHSSSPSSQEIHQRVLQTHLLSGVYRAFDNLVISLANGQTAPDIDSVDAFLSQKDAELLERIPLMENPALDEMTAVQAMAAAQKQRNRNLMDVATTPQLTSIHQMLHHPPEPAVLRDFLLAAMAYQDAYLSSPVGLETITPSFGCHCQNPEHPHESWKTAVATRFPELGPPADITENAADPPPTPGPQIHFDRVVHAIPLPSSGSSTEYVIKFENSGSRDLEVIDVSADPEVVTVKSFDALVPPQGRGSISVRINNFKPTPSTQSLWVRTNSDIIDDFDLGNEVILRLPAAVD